MFGFCKPVSSKKRFLPHREIDKNFSFTLYAKASDIDLNDWNEVVNSANLFLNASYLKLIETCGYSKLSGRYAIIYYRKKACGILYFQVMDFKAGTLSELIAPNDTTNDSKRLNIFERYIDANKNDTLLRLFSCGNNLLSGQHGFFFNDEIKPEKAHELVLALTNVVAKEEKLSGVISATLIKDFKSPFIGEKLFEENKYAACCTEPNLVASIPESVTNLDDYIALFSKKYRNRAKAIFRDLEGVGVRDLNLGEVKHHEIELFALYENIFNQAKFKLSKLPTNYFSQTKGIFESNFLVKAFFKNNQIVAFASCFLMPHKELEAHYIGINYSLNAEHNLYQNILYLLLETAITANCTQVNLGRTAAEIKTTVGAVAEDLICYIKPQNTLSKIIQKPFMALLQPSPWIPRNPFKNENNPTIAGL